MGAFDATGTPAVRAEQAQKAYKKTAIYSTNAVANTWDPASDHMGVTASATVVAADAGKSIVITDVVATYNATVLTTVAFSFTLAEQDSTSDILRMSVNGGGPAMWKGLYQLPKDKDLVAFLGQLNTGFVGTITVTYLQV